MKPGHWRQGDDRVIPFGDEDTAALAAYLNSIYHPYLLGLIVRDLTWANFDTEYTNLCGVYVVSDMLIDDEMKEAVFEQLKALSAMKLLPSRLATEEKLHAPPVEAIQFIYSGTTEKDPMRKLLIDLFTAHGDPSYAPHILISFLSTINLTADFTWDFELSLMSARTLPQTTVDATTKIIDLKLDLQIT
jgi:hypothetical protein